MTNPGLSPGFFIGSRHSPPMLLSLDGERVVQLFAARAPELIFLLTHFGPLPNMRLACRVETLEKPSGNQPGRMRHRDLIDG